MLRGDRNLRAKPVQLQRTPFRRGHCDGCAGSPDDSWDSHIRGALIDKAVPGEDYKWPFVPNAAHGGVLCMDDGLQLHYGPVFENGRLQGRAGQVQPRSHQPLSGAVPISGSVRRFRPVHLLRAPYVSDVEGRGV